MAYVRNDLYILPLRSVSFGHHSASNFKIVNSQWNLPDQRLLQEEVSKHGAGKPLKGLFTVTTIQSKDSYFFVCLSLIKEMKLKTQTINAVFLLAWWRNLDISKVRITTTDHQHQEWVTNIRDINYLVSLSSLLLSLFKHGRHRNFILRGCVSGQEKKLCQP